MSDHPSSGASLPPPAQEIAVNEPIEIIADELILDPPLGGGRPDLTDDTDSLG